MNQPLHTLVALFTAGMLFLSDGLLAADAQVAATPPGPTVSRAAVAAWEELLAADASIAAALAASRLAEVPAQAERIKAAIAAIGRSLQPPDKTLVRRFNSAAREVLALADRLSAVAATGNRARADVIYANLHRYVDFVQARLPRGEVPNHARNSP